MEEGRDTDFEMVYINPDGSVTFCGNGSRCAIHFAWKLGMINGGGLTTNFLAPDGPHTAYIVSATNTVIPHLNRPQQIPNLHSRCI